MGRALILDAAGHEPAPLTSYERRLRSDLQEGGKFYQRQKDLIAFRKFSLSEKIELSLDRINEWGEHWGWDKVAVSYSGGKDSSVLLWLVRQIKPNCPGIFANTGLEYPEVVRLVKSTSDIHIVRPKIPFHHVIRDHGWPMVSKKVARGIKIMRHPTGKNQNIVRLYNEGINRFGEKVSGFQVPKRWRFLIDAPFEVSDKCCEIMKKEPMHRASKELGGITQFIGTMASDSKAREKTYLQHGCNAFEMKTPRSTPMGFWTEQDVFECIHTHKIPYASIYGNIHRERFTGEWKASGVHRTGCVYCGFGLHMDEGEINRLQRLHGSHPKLWSYCMDRLGLRGVLDYMRQHCPDRHVAECFTGEPIQKPRQLNMFSTGKGAH